MIKKEKLKNLMIKMNFIIMKMNLLIFINNNIFSLLKKKLWIRDLAKSLINNIIF